MVKEQWIRAKYERKEFTNVVDTPYSKGYLEGFLHKRGKEDGKFNLRRFVLNQSEGTLKYYVKHVSQCKLHVVIFSNACKCVG